MKETLMKKAAFLILLMLICISNKCRATYVDELRSGTIVIVTNNAKKSYEAMMAAQALNTTGHMWIKDETQKIVDFQTQFYNYINSFHDVLYMAAEIYGLYYQVSQTVDNVKELSQTVAESPTNVIAAAFSMKRDVYLKVAETSFDILMDIKNAVLDESKMTEFQRFKIFMQVRPKLVKLNKELRRLNLTIKYTSFADVWREIVGKTYRTHNLREIANACLDDWKVNYKKIQENIK